MAVDGEPKEGDDKNEQQQDEAAAAAPDSTGPKPLDERTMIFALYDLLRSVDIAVG
jgi:hypothetical protein